MMDSPLQRYGSVVGVKKRHGCPLPGLARGSLPDVLAVVKRSHIGNYSIYLRQLADGRHYLFSYFEYAGTDFAGDMARMIGDPVTKRWWAECVPCLELLPDRAPGEVWSPMTEVFHLA